MHFHASEDALSCPSTSSYNLSHLEEIAMKKDPHARLKTVSSETKDILQELEKEYKAPEKEDTKKEVGTYRLSMLLSIILDDISVCTELGALNQLQVADKFNAAHYSTGMVAASFTSTAMMPETVHEAAIICEDEVKYDRVKKKGKQFFFLISLVIDCATESIFMCLLKYLDLPLTIFRLTSS